MTPKVLLKQSLPRPILSVSSRVDFKWPDSISQKLVVSQSIRVKIQIAIVVDGRFCDGLKPVKH